MMRGSHATIGPGPVSHARVAWLETVATIHTGWMAPCDRRIPVAREVDDGGEPTHA